MGPAHSGRPRARGDHRGGGGRDGRLRVRFYAQIVSGSTSLTRLDRDFFDMGRHLKADWAVDAAKVISDLGSFGIVAVLLVAASIVLIHEHRLAELAVLLLGTAIVYFGVDIAKDLVDRPRPAGPLVETAESAFPSGHAAYSTIWVAVAVVLTRGRGSPDRRRSSRAHWCSRPPSGCPGCTCARTTGRMSSADGPWERRCSASSPRLP